MEVAGWFVSKEELGLGNDRASDAHKLLLSAGNITIEPSSSEIASR